MNYLRIGILALLCNISLCPIWGQKIPTPKKIEQAVQKAAETHIPRPMSVPVPSPQIAQSVHMFTVGLGTSPAKTFLNNHLKYQEEVRRASMLYDQIRLSSIGSLPAPDLRQNIQSTIINQTLRTSLLRHLEMDDPVSMLNELEDYYHLAPNYIPTFTNTTMPAESFAWNVLHYLRKHQHKPNWPLRHILRTEGIDDTLKEEIKRIVNAGAVEPGQYEAAHITLRTMYEQYIVLLEENSRAPEIQETVEIYKNLAEQLEDFVAAHRRLPNFSQTDIEERNLFNRLIVLAYDHQPANCFEQLIPHIEHIYKLLEQYPSAHFTETETIREITKFSQKYHEFPRGVYQRDIFNPRPQEPLLYESMLYWQRNSSKFRNFLRQLYRQQTGSGYYPPYF